jgi:alkyl hydroperoxide reductase subunit AhpC
VTLSVDGLSEHARWISDIESTLNVKVRFPLIADKDRQLSMLFGMLDATRFGYGASLGQTMTVASVVVISPGKRVELIQAYPGQVGRSFEEILRVIDALQLSSKCQLATPADWRPGEDTVVLPFISDEDAEEMMAADQNGVRKARSYMRFLRDPSLRVL